MINKISIMIIFFYLYGCSCCCVNDCENKKNIHIFIKCDKNKTSENDTVCITGTIINNSISKIAIYLGNQYVINDNHPGYFFIEIINPNGNLMQTTPILLKKGRIPYSKEYSIVNQGDSIKTKFKIIICKTIPMNIDWNEEQSYKNNLFGKYKIILHYEDVFLRHSCAIDTINSDTLNIDYVKE
jgi:hypothetical protein